MNHPTISVIIPVYNGEKYLPEAIDSILKQTFQDFEIIVIDDGSRDSSVQIIRALNDARIVKVFHKENRGLTTTLNEGINLARGLYIARLDQDDVSEPQRFEDAVNAFKEKPQSLAVFGTIERMGPDGKISGSYKIKNQQPTEEWSFKRHGMIIHGAALFCKNALLEEKELFRKELWPCDDLDLNLRLSRCGLLTVINKPALKYRIHPNSETFTTFFRMRFITRYLLKIDELEKISHKTIEMSQEEYNKMFESNFFRKCVNKMDDYGQLFFRRGGLSFASHSKIKGSFYLLLGVILSPRFALGRLSRLTKNTP